MTISFAARRAALLTLPCALLSAAPALALEEAEAADEGRTIIVTGSHLATEAETLIRGTPGGANIVSHSDYADKSLVSLRDALAFSPGVYTQPRYGQEIRLSIRGSGLSRGFHMRGLTLLQDGIPINLADDNGDFQELEPIFFDHLEVWRGANALRLGSATLGGAINGVTPRGTDAPGTYLRADVGSFDMVRGLVSHGGASGPADYWFGLSADSSGGDRVHAERRSIRFHGNVGLAVSDVVSTRFHASINRIRQQLPGALTAAVALSAPETGNLTGNQQRNIDSARIQNRTRFDWGATRLDVGVFLNVKDLDHPIFQVIDQKSTDTGGFARLDHQAGPLAFTMGGDFRHGTMRARQFVNVNGEKGALTFDADQTARTASVYAEARLTPLDGVTMIAGAVYADGWRKRHVLLSAAQDGRIAFDELSPKFGLLVEPTRNIQFFANISRSAELPGYGEVFQSVGTPPLSSFIAAIRPQHAWTAEIGTRGRSGWLNWDLAAYRATLDGEMLQYSVSSSIPAATFNAGHTRHSGIEAGLALNPAPWLRLRQLWHYADFHFINDAQFGNNRLPVVPRHMLRTEVRLGTDGLHLAPNVEWVPQGPFADYANSTRTPGYAIVGLTAGATLARGVDLFLDARNIFDKAAIGDVSATLTANSASAIYYPVERRAITGGVRMRL
jgi:iron complex outermembrane receptor protein